MQWRGVHKSLDIDIYAVPYQVFDGIKLLLFDCIEKRPVSFRIGILR